MKWKLTYNLDEVFNFNYEKCFGNVYIGRYCIDLLSNGESLTLDYYLLYEDVGSGYTLSGIPYSYKDGICLNLINLPKDLCNFKKTIEKEIMKGFETLHLNLNYVYQNTLEWK